MNIEEMKESAEKHPDPDEVVEEVQNPCTVIGFPRSRWVDHNLTPEQSAFRALIPNAFLPDFDAAAEKRRKLAQMTCAIPLNLLTHRVSRGPDAHLGGVED